MPTMKPFLISMRGGHQATAVPGTHQLEIGLNTVVRLIAAEKFAYFLRGQLREICNHHGAYKEKAARRICAWAAR